MIRDVYYAFLANTVIDHFQIFVYYIKKKDLSL